MTVSDLIKKLKKFDGNLDVEVQYRDASGDYCGTDNDIYLYVKNNKLIL